ncbi:DUF6221 family protein [Streptomyces sp. NPDC058872]|uniref:DUF6221 family protein n=1 Tax=Streptomyces sp. NPDC058872 TaxID=3346661 RepID=UPI003686588D
MTVDLVEFLTARLDEDERVIEAPETWTAFDENEPTGTRRVDVDHSFERVTACTRAWRGVHIARHDPARVLAEVDAKRRIVERHGPAVLCGGGGAQYYNTTRVCRSCESPKQFPEQAWPCPTLRLLALPYAGHADYDEAWRP